MKSHENVKKIFKLVKKKDGSGSDVNLPQKIYILFKLKNKKQLFPGSIYIRRTWKERKCYKTFKMIILISV